MVFLFDDPYTWEQDSDAAIQSGIAGVFGTVPNPSGRLPPVSAPRASLTDPPPFEHLTPNHSPDEMPGAQVLELPRPRPRSTGAWWRVLLIGIALYALGVGILALTGNPNLFPSVFLLGNFLVPVSYVAFFYERRHLSRLSLPTTALTFLYGGFLGVFAAAVLEPLFIRQLDFGSALVVGLIEEFAKIIGVLVVARRQRHGEELDGLILGAAAGMGFAALESTGYAFTTFLASGGSISLFVGVTLLRGVLSPLGHGTWTAILAGVLFRETRKRRFRLDRAVLGAYLTVSLLHGLWDGLPGLLNGFLAPGVDVLAALALVSATGLFLLWWRWREAVRLQASDRATLASPIGGLM